MLGSNTSNSNTSRIQLKIFQTPRGAAAFLYDNIMGYGQLSGNIRVGRRFLQVQNCGEKCHVLGRVHTNAPRLFSGDRGEWSEVKSQVQTFGPFYSSINPGATVKLDFARHYRESLKGSSQVARICGGNKSFSSLQKVNKTQISHLISCNLGRTF